MRLACALALLVAWRTAAADEAPAPRWVAGPDRAYNCTHYLDAPIAWRSPPRVAPGEPMKLVMRAGKVMTFTLSARPATKRGKVRYALETPPPGMTLAGAKVTWTVAGASGQQFGVTLLAIGDDGAQTRWPLHITIASDQLVTAWSAGMGSVWPDCTNYDTGRYQVADLDGDGKDDVIYARYAGDDGTTETRVMLQRGTLKFVEATTCVSCSPTPEVAVDGSRLLVLENDCCCILSVTVLRITGDTTETAADWQVPSSCTADPGDATRIVFDRDARQRITGVAFHPERGAVHRMRWRNKTFEPSN